MSDPSNKDTRPEERVPNRDPASGRAKRDTMRECPESKRELTAGMIIALAELELYTR